MWSAVNDSEICFSTQFVLDEWKIRIKAMPSRFEQCLGPVNTLTLGGCSETRAFWHSRKHILPSQ